MPVQTGIGRSALRGVVAVLASVALLAGAAPLAAAGRSVPSGPQGRVHGGHGGVAMLVPHRITFLDAVRAGRAHAAGSRAYLRMPLRSRPVAGPASGAAAGAGSTEPTRRAPLQPIRATTGLRPLIVLGSGQLTTRFDGITQADAGGGIEPPDPWLAVSPSFVVTSTNGLVRVSNRDGVKLADVPTAALFGVLAGQEDSDPRIIWDAFHSRWVGIELAHNLDDTHNFLILLVSETADPLGAWDNITFDSVDVLPDFPGLASSTDKIVITTNDFAGGLFLGGEIDEIGWAQVLSGGLVPFNYSDPDTEIWTPRPAQVLSPTPDVHLIADGNSTHHLLHRRLSGPASRAPTGLAQYTDLSADPDLAFGNFGTPTAPHQPGVPATIVDAVDERPTDAVWRNNRLWLVATHPHDFGTGAVDAVRIIRVNTTSVPDVTYDNVVGSDGKDTFMGGVGLLADGTLVLTYNYSSPTLMVRSAMLTLDGASDLPSPEMLIADSAGTYAGTRWGDFAGVAADPVGGLSAWVIGQTAAVDGTWRTHLARLTYDNVPPSAAGVVSQAIVASTTIRSTASVRMSWAAVQDAGSGVHHYLVTMVDNTDPLNPVVSISSTTSLSIVRSLRIGSYYYFTVQAVDGAGNVGGASPVTGSRVLLYQQTNATFGGGWHSAASSGFSGGTAKFATLAGRTGTFAFTGRAVGYLAALGPSRGRVKVYVDGRFRTTINLFRSTNATRQIVFSSAWSSSAGHKVKLVVVGTARHPRVDVDGFVVLR